MRPLAEAKQQEGPRADPSRRKGQTGSAPLLPPFREALTKGVQEK